MAMPVMGYRVSMSVFGGKADIINCGTSGSRLLAMKMALARSLSTRQAVYEVGFKNPKAPAATRAIDGTF
jgi:hypothetical protein